MTITITSSPGTAYTWTIATWNWDNSLATKTWDTAYPTSYTCVEDDVLATAELKAIDYTSLESEAFATAELASRNHTTNQSDTLVVSDAASDIVTFIRDQPEAVTVSDAIVSVPLMGFSEAFAVADTGDITADFYQFFSENMVFSETYIDLISFILSVSETIQFDELSSKDYADFIAEAFSFAEGRASDIDNPTPETLTFSEVYIDLINFVQAFGETITFTEAKTATTLKRFAEALAVADMFMRNAKARIGDIELKNEFMTPTQFAALRESRAPLGYQDWKEFLPGDFKYQDAVIWLHANVPDRSQVVSIPSAHVRVDVPDVVETGSASVPTTGVFIPFTRTFHIVPEITMVQKSGSTVSIPQFVGSPTTTGFTVKLVDANNPSVAVAGSISFTALGY